MGKSLTSPVPLASLLSTTDMPPGLFVVSSGRRVTACAASSGAGIFAALAGLAKFTYNTASYVKAYKLALRAAQRARQTYVSGEDSLDNTEALLHIRDANRIACNGFLLHDRFSGNVFGMEDALQRAMAHIEYHAAAENARQHKFSEASTLWNSVKARRRALQPTGSAGADSRTLWRLGDMHAWPNVAESKNTFTSQRLTQTARVLVDPP